MSEERKILRLPAQEEEIRALKAGDSVLLYGTLYTARDAAHARMAAELEQGKPLLLAGGAVYYAGPTPPPPGWTVGSIGPTTSSRIDSYTPRFMELGLKVVVGKGPRAEAVREACAQFGGIYLVTTGGAGALLAQCVRSAEVIAYDDLGCEAVHKLQVEAFPAFVAFDTRGNSIFEQK